MTSQPSCLTGVELREGIEGGLALFVNDYEFGLVQKMTGMDAADMLQYLQFVVVTCGKDGSRIYSREREYHVPVFTPEQLADPTGVGDAYRGGFWLATAMRDLETCASRMAAATYCVEQYGTQGHTYKPADFVKRFREGFDDHGQLDRLLDK
jgi:adenosine kinase